MKPPICSICDKDFIGEGGLIYFKETKNDEIHNKRLHQKEMIGHPPNAFWFCENHIELARKYSHLTKTEAFKEMRKENK